MTLDADTLVAILREHARLSYDSRRFDRDGCQCYCDPVGDIESAFLSIADKIELATRTNRDADHLNEAREMMGGDTSHMVDE